MLNAIQFNSELLSLYLPQTLIYCDHHSSPIYKLYNFMGKDYSGLLQIPIYLGFNSSKYRGVR